MPYTGVIYNDWKADLFPYVGKAFDVAYANRLNKFAPIVGEINTNSVSYELTGSGGYGEPQAYDGENLNRSSLKRAFKTTIVPVEYQDSVVLGYKEVKIDKMGETKKAGTRLGQAMGMKVYLGVLRMFGNAFSAEHLGGDDKPWAAADHPVAAKSSDGRKFIADPDAGTYSNLITEALSVSAITHAQSLAGRFVTPDGLPFMADMNVLLVSPELEPVAKQICGENAKLTPNQAENVNPAQDMQYIVVGGGQDGFTANQWAICDKALMKELVNIIYITKPTVMENKLDNPLQAQFLSYADFDCGWGDARQIIFSTGAGA